MGALEMKVTATLGSLDPKRAKVLESAIEKILEVASPEIEPHVEVNANGWPIGYWESVVGCLYEGDDWEPPADPPPEPHPY